MKRLSVRSISPSDMLSVHRYAHTHTHKLGENDNSLNYLMLAHTPTFNLFLILYSLTLIYSVDLIYGLNTHLSLLPPEYTKIRTIHSQVSSLQKAALVHTYIHTHKPYPLT
jgi:hypothetical protein